MTVVGTNLPIQDVCSTAAVGVKQPLVRSPLQISPSHRPFPRRRFPARSAREAQGSVWQAGARGAPGPESAQAAFAGARLSKVQSVDQRMRLECGVGFRQLRTCRRTRPGQLCAISGSQVAVRIVEFC